MPLDKQSTRGRTAKTKAQSKLEHEQQQQKVTQILKLNNGETLDNDTPMQITYQLKHDAIACMIESNHHDDSNGEDADTAAERQIYDEYNAQHAKLGGSFLYEIPHYQQVCAYMYICASLYVL